MWKIDTTQRGIQSIFKEYEWIALDHIYEKKTRITSRSTHNYVDERKKISRASIIHLLEKFVNAGIIDYDEESGKGGFHKIHSVLTEREDLPRKITLDALRTLNSVFPVDPFINEVIENSMDILPVTDRPR